MTTAGAEKPPGSAVRLNLGVWPRTLLWRTFLLIASLVLLSVAAWFAIFSNYEREPRARQLAQTLVSVANLTRVSLLSARPDARMGLLRELSDREGIHIYPAERGEIIEPLPDSLFLQLVLEHVREQLGPRTRLTLSRNGESALFVSFLIDDDPKNTANGDSDDEFWVALPRERIERRFPINWVGWGAAVLLLSLAGAWLIVFRITRPLKAIERAARKVGAGETPPVLPEQGPDEVIAVARAFNHMSADLARLDQDRALILAGISHDLRTPLTRLRMGIEMTADAEMREGMSTDVEEMDKTIAQFLDFARAGNSEAGDNENADRVDVSALVRELAESYQRRRLPVTVDDAVSPAPTFVRGRPQALRRAIANLIDNALRYAPGHPPRLDCRQTGSTIEVSVTDKGPGIPAAEIDRVRRPFTRLDSARSNVVGAGLGLAIVERIVRSHGGQLELANGDGAGLIARITLPASL